MYSAMHYHALYAMRPCTIRYATMHYTLCDHALYDMRPCTIRYATLSPRIACIYIYIFMGFSNLNRLDIYVYMYTCIHTCIHA